MNKKLLVVMAMLLLCTGCTKKLTCTKTHSDTDDVTGTEKYVFKFDKDGNSTSASVSLVMDFGDEYDSDELDELIDNMKKTYEDTYGYKDVSIKAKGTKLSIKFTMDIDKDDAKTYDEVKETFTDDDYKCK